MHDHEVFEPCLLADAPRLVVVLPVVAVEDEDAEDVCGSEGYGDFGAESEVVEGFVYAERRSEGAFFNRWWKGMRKRSRNWREGRRPGEVDVWPCSHFRPFFVGMRRAAPQNFQEGNVVPETHDS